jgi:hypothetical protein
MIAGGAVSGVVMLAPRSPLPPETIKVSLNAKSTSAKKAAYTASLPSPGSRAEDAPVIIPASSIVPDFSFVTRSKTDSLIAAKPVPVPRRKPFGQLRFAMAAAPNLILSESDVGAGFALPRIKTYGNWPKNSVLAARERCEKVLRGLDVEFKSRDPIGNSSGCGVAYPLSVSAIAGVQITPAATLNCDMVKAVHKWITEVVQPTAKREFNTRLVGLQNASSYACRRRNNATKGKLSEHALGNALDIAEFKFSNRVEASVAGGWNGATRGLSITNRGSFMKTSRKGACTYFNTVLGPGSDPFHKDHFHLDLMKLRPGRGKYCR